ncbi:hypothetical protein [uncultured Planococcus sp.]|uniref:Cap15 family cyclic dinucleotide receptor domain-containing protein n=1 Tax=uncultured Planococcus sp. TaxID=337815 RepID=UPI00260A5772|nr:hypothetical protein [uncultured Planococcus sp.]
MHEYSIDVDQKNIIFYIAAFSIALSSLLTALIGYLTESFPIVSFWGPVTAISIFGLLYTVFDKKMWRWKALKKIGLVKVPDLDGEWEGTFNSSFHEFNESFPAQFKIEQTWTRICIMGRFNDSKSSSYTSAIKVNAGGGIQVFYSYQNEKNAEKADEPFSDHKGYGSLLLNKEENKIEGTYFNNPSNNRNHGRLKLQRKP